MKWTEERMSISEVAQMLGVSRYTIWKWARAGLLPVPVRIGGRQYYLKSEMEVWVEERKAERYPPSDTYI